MMHDSTCPRAMGWGTCDCGIEAHSIVSLYARNIGVPLDATRDSAPAIIDQIRTAAIRAASATPDALQRALTVKRKDWKVGMEVWGPFYAQDRHVLWTIVDVDWNRGAGPLICQWFDEQDGATHQSFFQPWDLTRDQDVPRTLDEVRAFLNG